MSGASCFCTSCGITRLITVFNAEAAACPKRQAVFVFSEKKGTEITVEEEENQMKKLYFDIHRAILLPSGEIKTDEPISNGLIKQAE